MYLFDSRIRLPLAVACLCFSTSVLAVADHRGATQTTDFSDMARVCPLNTIVGRQLIYSWLSADNDLNLVLNRADDERVLVSLEWVYDAPPLFTTIRGLYEVRAADGRITLKQIRGDWAAWRSTLRVVRTELGVIQPVLHSHGVGRIHVLASLQHDISGPMIDAFDQQLLASWRGAIGQFSGSDAKICGG